MMNEDDIKRVNIISDMQVINKVSNYTHQLLPDYPIL